MTKKEFAKEVGMVGAIISDCIFERLYKVCQENGAGYIQSAETIGDWALEFVTKNLKTDWEEVLTEGMEPKSKEVSNIICWDDAIHDFSYYKLEQMK